MCVHWGSKVLCENSALSVQFSYKSKTALKIPSLFIYFTVFIYFIWLRRGLGMRDLQLQRVSSQFQHVGSSSLTRDGAWTPHTGSTES